MARNFYILTRDGTPIDAALVTSETSAAPRQLPGPVTLGDKESTVLYFVDGAGNFVAMAGTVRFAVSVPGLAPTGGTFFLGFGTATSGTLTTGKRYKISTFVAGDDFTNVGAASNATGVVFTATGTTPTTWTNGSTLIEITTDLSYAITAADLQTALNAMASVAAAGNVTVSGTAPNWLVQFNSVGARDTMSGDGTGLISDGQCFASTVQTGSTTVRARQHVRLLRKAFVLQDSWASSGNGYTAVVDYGTYGLADYLGDDTNRSDGLKLEVEVTDGSGNPRTYLQIPIEAKNESVNPSSFLPVPYADYYTKTEVDALLAAVTVTNTADYETISFSAAGNSDVTPIANARTHVAVATAAAGAGAYTRTVSLLTANASDGTQCRVRLAMPASANPTVEIRNASSGGTLLLSVAGAATAFNIVADFAYTGAAWVLVKTFYESGPNIRWNGNLFQVLDDDGSTWRSLKSTGGQLYLV